MRVMREKGRERNDGERLEWWGEWERGVMGERNGVLKGCVHLYSLSDILELGFKNISELIPILFSSCQ